MKFLSLAIATLFGIAEGKRVLSAEQFQARLSNGQFNKNSLMRGAKPYNEAARRRVQEGQDNWQISGLYSVQFSECISFKVQDEDLFGENYIESASQGLLLAEKSFILFSVCESDSCSSQSSSDKMKFVTDVTTFFQAFADFLPSKVEQYCEGCNQNYDYCMGNLDAQNNQAAQQGEGQQEGQAEGQQAEEQQAEEQQPEEQQAEGQQAEGQEPEGQQAEGQEAEGQQGEGQQAEGQQAEGQEAEGQQAEGQQAEGQQAEGQQGGRRLQEGEVVEMIECDMCNAYDCFTQDEQGNDFEEALNWLNAVSKCVQMDSLYNDLPVYAGLLCNAEGTGVEIGVFVDQDCHVYAPKVSYGSLMSEADTQYYTMSEDVVEYMFTNDFNCYQPRTRYSNPYEYVADENQNANQQGNGEAPEASEWCNNLYKGNMQPVNLANCGNQDEEQVYDENLDTYSWYSYHLTQEQSNDGAEVCQAVNALNGGHLTVYDKKNGGTLYKYKSRRNSMRPAGIAALVIALVLIAVCVTACAKKRKGNDRKVPLIDPRDGTFV